MELRAILKDDEAVSPVIGVILMVAITVILAAVIASFVLGLGQDTQQTTPQASFAFDYDGTSADGNLTITHDGGDTIQAQELYIRGSDLGDDVNTGAWHNVDNSYAATSEISAGQSVTLETVSGTYEVRVVFEAQEGDQSATLGQDSGPEA